MQIWVNLFLFSIDDKFKIKIYENRNKPKRNSG